MDTLSRKHRLRQQQERYRNQQVLYGCKENQREQFEEYEQVSCGSHKNNNNNNGIGEEEEEEEQFRVFKVVEIRKAKGQFETDQQFNISHHNQPTRNCKLNEKSYEQQSESNDQVLSIVYNNQQVVSSLKRSPLYANTTNNNNDNSTGYSSGFLSEGSGTQSSRSRSTRSNKRNSPSKQHERSRVIDELDRLMLDVERTSTDSPAESYLSCADLVSQNEKAAEFDYATLCRDEFSSFIAVQNLQSDQQQSVRSGPMLVGVHTDCPSERAESSIDSSASDLFDLHEVRSSSSSISSRNGVASQTDEDELVLSDRGQFANYCQVSPIKQADLDSNLSKMLDVYLNRVESLLKLVRGDKFVSMEEAFGCDGGLEIEVGDEHRTRIEYAPLDELVKTKVIQEIKMIEMSIDEADEEEEDKCYTETKVFTHNFKSLLSSTQTSATLDWTQVEANSISKRFDRIESSEELEESLINKLLSDVRDDFKFQTNLKSSHYLVNTVKRHLSEFIHNYNEYQSELKAKNSFANDWHQNWLFAFKRPNEESNNQIESQVCLKRVKMAPSSLDIKPTSGQQQVDLIKYSTLIISKSSPVKSTCLTLMRNKVEGYEVIEDFYEAQEERLNELQKLAIESSRQLDACKLLLCDTDDNIKSAIGQKKKPVGSKAEGLKVSYNSSSSTRNTNYLSFSAFGYLFQSKLFTCLAAEIELLKVKKSILNKLHQLSINDHQQNICSSLESEKVKFLINLTNVELINELPVVQFCAKVTGSLPISVRWFKSDSELSNISQAPKRTNLKIKHLTQIGTEWPIELHANYDFEYQTEWSSWFRFKRCQSDILFEIREANIECDYNETYKCVIQNYCSRSECKFTLTKRQVNQAKSFKICKLKTEKPVEKCTNALLRTWSQRTLNKPQPQTNSSLIDCTNSISDKQFDDDCESKNYRQLSTLNRRLVSCADNEDRFGKNFPYHPMNLLKRLEENKFSLKRVKNNRHLQVDLAQTCSSPTNEPQIQFVAHSFAEQQNFESQQVQLSREEETMTNEQAKVQPIEVKAQVPKPRSRIKLVANTNELINQVSRLPDLQQVNKRLEEASKLLSNPNETQSKSDIRLKDTEDSSNSQDWIPKANVKSLISRFS